MANEAQVKATTKHRKKRKARSIGVTFYLDNPQEKKLYDEWKKIENKKQFVIKILENRLKNKK